MSDIDELASQVAKNVFNDTYLNAALISHLELERLRLFDHQQYLKKHAELMDEVSSVLTEEPPAPEEKDQEIIKPFIPKPSRRNKFDRLNAIYSGNKQKGNKLRVYRYN